MTNASNLIWILLIVNSFFWCTLALWSKYIFFLLEWIDCSSGKPGGHTIIIYLRIWISNTLYLKHFVYLNLHQPPQSGRRIPWPPHGWCHCPRLAWRWSSFRQSSCCEKGKNENRNLTSKALEAAYRGYCTFGKRGWELLAELAEVGRVTTLDGELPGGEAMLPMCFCPCSQIRLLAS